MDSLNLDESLVIKYSIGKDEKGNDIFKKQRFSNINLGAGDDAIFEVAKVIEGIIDSNQVYLIKEESNLFMDS
ncbi:DUF1659 domain-containing protein [Inconstantimicrobium mannanitabidum]|uniref:Uncharacterized protein n=1 Tax=Inconstantimicrobium mannanitabidum TaxID=1604901 RepID=A0ACB5RG83_9CLOT|nr:DUF1659 domain-containing protein [Clostridium sp. TW13]GKX68100.1 hypothetical protein rsdtw13_33580 [Clostridium sp. TW13]